VIAIVYPQFYGVGGIARYLDSFLANIPEGSPAIVLITSQVDGAPRSFPGVQIINLDLPRTRVGLLVWALRARRRLRELHRAGRIRRANLHWPPLIPGLFLPSEIPLTLTAHTTYVGMSGAFNTPRQFSSPWNPLSLAIKFWMERRILARASKVIALTSQGEQEVRRYGFGGPVSVVPNGSDIRQFTPHPDVEKRFDVLFCGRIEHRKGSRPMVALCKRLIARNPQIKIAIVGYGDDETWVRGELGCAKNVHMSGKVAFDAMQNYYDASRVYVSTSYYEGLPGTCLEAMSMQLPVVVWDQLFYRDLVREGRTGFLVPTNDLAAMEDRVIALLEDRNTAIRIGRAGRELVATVYDWRALSPRIVSELV
jgi:glycosyltransferase involved in cell wall biosynthesis